MVQASESVRQSAIRAREERKHRAWLERAEMMNAYYRVHGRFPGVLGYLGHLRRRFAVGVAEGKAERKATRAHPLFFVRRILFWLWLSGAVGCFCAQVAHETPHPSRARVWATVMISAAWPGVLVAAWVFHRFDFGSGPVDPTPIAEAISA